MSEPNQHPEELPVADQLMISQWLNERRNDPAFRERLQRRLEEDRVILEKLARQHDCVCGEPATTLVAVPWSDHPRRYRYCEECALDVVDIFEGAEVLP